MKRTAFLLAAIPLLLWLAIFPVLTFDAVGKLLTQRVAFEPANLLLVLYLELSRALTTMVALIVALVLIVRAARAAEGRALALFLIFTALTYEKSFGTIGYTGPLQEALTETLLRAGVNRSVLTWFFGPVPWTIWPALAALLRFSVTFPPPGLSVAAIAASGAHDRRGALRGNAVAGADIGAALRIFSMRALQANAFRALPLWLGALVLVAAMPLIGATANLVLLAVGMLLTTSLAITNLRAAHSTAAEPERRQMDWLTLAFAAGGAIFITAALPMLFFNDPAAVVPAVILLMVAPAVTMCCLALAVLYDGPIDAGRLVTGVPYLGAHVLSMLVLFALFATVPAALLALDGTWRALGLVAAVAVTSLAAVPLRRLTDRSVDRVLERTWSSNPRR